MRRTDTKAHFRARAGRRSPFTVGEAQMVCERVLAWLGARQPSPTLVWMAMGGELDLSPVVEALPGREWLTTRTPSSGPLTVHPYHSRSERHRFGFRQPVATSSRVPPSRIGVVLAPGLVFDRHGGRLGWGMGYYDRLLAKVEPQVPKVGVTLERWLEDRLPQEPHDIAMTHLVTDRRVREFS